MKVAMYVYSNERMQMILTIPHQPIGQSADHHFSLELSLSNGHVLRIGGERCIKITTYTRIRNGDREATPLPGTEATSSLVPAPDIRLAQATVIAADRSSVHNTVLSDLADTAVTTTDSVEEPGFKVEPVPSPRLPNTPAILGTKDDVKPAREVTTHDHALATSSVIKRDYNGPIDMDTTSIHPIAGPSTASPHAPTVLPISIPRNNAPSAFSEVFVEIPPFFREVRQPQSSRVLRPRNGRRRVDYKDSISYHCRRNLN
jgi:hypothetical protein